jgi:hypothetical protein
MHTQSPDMPKKFNQTLSVCQKAGCNCFIGEERSDDGEIHAKMDSSNFRTVLRNVRKIA